MKAKLAVLDLVLRQLGIELDNSQEVQKVVYLVQAEGVPMGYRYAWYDNGPGSPRLAEAAYQLKLETTDLQEGESAHSRRLRPAFGDATERVRSLIKVPKDVESDLNRGEWLELLASFRYLVDVLKGDVGSARAILEERKYMQTLHLYEAERELELAGLLDASIEARRKPKQVVMLESR